MLSLVARGTAAEKADCEESQSRITRQKKLVFRASRLVGTVVKLSLENAGVEDHIPKFS
jgi:hypothetical protein